MKKCILVIVAILLCISFPVYVFVVSIAGGQAWQIWVSGTGLIVVLMLSLVFCSKLLRKA